MNCNRRLLLHVRNISFSYFHQIEGFVEESICGRPLGMAFDTISDNLIVSDAYYGIWSVDLNNGRKTLLVSPTEELDGKVKYHLFICLFIHNYANHLIKS